MRNKILIVASLLIIASMVLAACAPTQAPAVQTVVVTQVVEKEGQQVVVTQVVEKEVTAVPPTVEEPVTLNWNFETEPPTIDPALATDTTSVDVVANLFVGLTVFDPETGAVNPYLATEWEAGEDADGNQTWTFHLRDDISWVNYDPVSGEFTQETDADGNPRMVTANDVVYGVKRTLDPATASDYAYVLYIIKNGQGFNTGAEGVTADDVGVAAPDDQTVVFTLEEPAAYFPSIAGMWVAKPQPQWAIEENENKWTEAGLIVTNGPYGLASWIHGGELDMVKNPLWVNADQVQIERIHGVMITEESTGFALYENNELDTVRVPLPEMDRVKADPQLSQELNIVPDVCTYYYGFTNTKVQFDDVRVRKAFIQSIDRQSLIDNVLKGGQIPATTFAPPGIFGAPEPGTLGLPYDPEAAKASLQSYLDEKGMTIDDFNNQGITLMYNTSEGHARIAAAIQQMWKDTLGVDVKVENQEWAVYLDTIAKETPVEDEPGVWRMGWCADYPDETNWVYEVFYSGEGFENRLRRNCDEPNCGSSHLSEFDNIVADAKLETDPDKRAEMYAQAEDILAAQEAAYAPIYHYTKVNVTKPWLQRHYPLLGGEDFYNWSIDMAAKQAAQ